MRGVLLILQGLSHPLSIPVEPLEAFIDPQLQGSRDTLEPDAHPIMFRCLFQGWIRKSRPWATRASSSSDKDWANGGAMMIRLSL